MILDKTEEYKKQCSVRCRRVYCEIKSAYVFKILIYLTLFAEARDYRNEFDPDDWMGPREYVGIRPSPVYTPLPIPGFEFLLAMSGGVVAAICLIRRKKDKITARVFAKCPRRGHLGEYRRCEPQARCYA